MPRPQPPQRLSALAAGRPKQLCWLESRRGPEWKPLTSPPLPGPTADPTDRRNSSPCECVDGGRVGHVQNRQYQRHHQRNPRQTGQHLAPASKATLRIAVKRHRQRCLHVSSSLRRQLHHMQRLRRVLPRDPSLKQARRKQVRLRCRK